MVRKEVMSDEAKLSRRCDKPIRGPGICKQPVIPFDTVISGINWERCDAMRETRAEAGGSSHRRRCV